MRIAALIAIAALVAGCQSPCPTTNTAPVAAVYDCVDGSTLNVTYYHNPNRAHVVQEGYTPLDLDGRSGGASVSYADQGVSLEGRMELIRLSRPGASNVECRLRAAPPAPSAQGESLYRTCHG